MNVTNNAALVDNDFICHISECKLPPKEICNSLKTIMTDLNRYAIMHTLIKRNELDISKMITSKVVIDLLFSETIISEITFDDIFSNDDNKKSYYAFLVKDFFSLLNPNDNTENMDVFTFWQSGKSLGEIHSLATCLICDCSIFLSDDTDSKKIAKHIESKFTAKIDVLNRSELVNLETVSKDLKRTTRKSLAHSLQ